MVSFKVEIDHDLKGLQRTLKRINARAIPKARQAALNRAGQSTRGAAIKATAKELGTIAKQVKKRVGFTKAQRGSGKFQIIGRGRELNLIVAAAKGETRKKAFRRGGVKALGRVHRGTFIGFENRGKPLVFERRGKARKAWFVPLGSVPEKLISRPVLRVVDRKFAERWPVELRSALRREIAKATR